MTRNLSHEDVECLRLGQEILRMIRELYSLTGAEHGYMRRNFSFRQGGAVLLLSKTAEVADVMDKAAKEHFNVSSVSPLTEPHG